MNSIQKELSAKLGIHIPVELQELIQLETLTQMPPFGKSAYIEKNTSKELAKV